MYCKKCGTQLEDGVQFCNKCGTSTSENPINMSNNTLNSMGAFISHEKAFALVLGLFCVLAPFWKSFEIPAISYVLGLTGISEGGSFSFYTLLKFFYVAIDGKVGELIELIKEICDEEFGDIFLSVFASLIIISIMAIVFYVRSLTLLIKNDSNSIKEGWIQLKFAAIFSAVFEIILLILCLILGHSEESDIGIISIKPWFYIELIIIITTIIISVKNYNVETLTQYRTMKQVNYNKTHVNTQNTWVCNCGKRNDIRFAHCPACGKERPFGVDIMKT